MSDHRERTNEVRQRPALSRLYRGLSRLVPSDITVVLALDCRARSPLAEPICVDPDVTLILRDEAAIRRAATSDEPDIADMLPRLGETSATLHGVVARHGGRAIGHAWFARDRVDATLNTGGNRFAGIGVELPPSACYVFRVQVAQAWQGHGVAAAMLDHGLGHLPGPPLDTAVTTTEWTNLGFRRVAGRLGFRQVGWAAEFVVGLRHVYRLPKPLARGGDDRPIRLVHGSV